MAAGRLEIDVTARLDRLDAGLQRAEQMIKKAGGQIDSAMNTPAGKVAMTMGKVLGSMAALEIGIKGFNAGMKLTEALTAEFSGSAQDADKAFMEMGEIVKQLPAGIGPVAQALEQLVMLTHSDDLARNEATAAQGRMREQIVESTKSQRLLVKQLERELDVLKEEDPIQKRRLEFRKKETELFEELARRTEEINKKFTDGPTGGLLKSLQDEIALRLNILKVQEDQLEAEENRARLEEDRNDMLKNNVDALNAIQDANDEKMSRMQATGSANTAMGRFTFGRNIDPEQQEELRAIKSVDESVKEILQHANLILPALRVGIGIM